MSDLVLYCNIDPLFDLFLVFDIFNILPLLELLVAKAKKNETETKHTAASDTDQDVENKSYAIHLRDTFPVSAAVFAFNLTVRFCKGKDEEKKKHNFH